MILLVNLFRDTSDTHFCIVIRSTRLARNTEICKRQFGTGSFVSASLLSHRSYPVARAKGGCASAFPTAAAITSSPTLERSVGSTARPPRSAASAYGRYDLLGARRTAGDVYPGRRRCLCL